MRFIFSKQNQVTVTIMQVYGFRKTGSKKRIMRSSEYYQNIINRYGDGVFSAVLSNDLIGKQVFKNVWVGDGEVSRNHSRS